jgi:hypothetical protein
MGGRGRAPGIGGVPLRSAMRRSRRAPAAVSAGRTATTSIVGNGVTGIGPHTARLLVALLATIVIATHTTALAHELEHVLHQHEAPCALHVAADHLTIVAPPVPLLVAFATLIARIPPSASSALLPSWGRASGARAPPCPA